MVPGKGPDKVITPGEENITIRGATERDRDAVVGIFNHYVHDGFAAYPEVPVTREFFDLLSHGAYSFYVLEKEAVVLGFAISRPFLPFSVFNRTALVTYFIDPSHTRRGLGGRLLDHLIQDSRARGIRVILASISSRNVQSLEFHRSHGFQESGRIRSAGIKHGKEFDLVWMQRDLE